LFEGDTYVYSSKYKKWFLALVQIRQDKQRLRLEVYDFKLKGTFALPNCSVSEEPSGGLLIQSEYDRMFLDPGADVVCWQAIGTFDRLDASKC
jgi:hypothetical protein